MKLLLTRTQPIIKVDVKHIPYIEALWNRLVEAEESIKTREEYVRTASTLGVKTEAISNVANRLHADSKRLTGSRKSLNRIKQVLAAGCEPTTPPKDWYCGHITEPKKIKNPDRWDRGPARIFPVETWPTIYKQVGRPSLVFNSAIPLSALAKYAKVQPILDESRIYSPNGEDFIQLRNPQPRPDPVLIGKIEFLGEPQYFEVARWDIDKDLAQIFG